MKIINVTPGLLPIPPNGWGAVEKIIWETHNSLLELGHDSEIKYLDDVKDYDVVHIHVANLANIAHERGIPYYFTMHDHHSYLYGKESDVFKENMLAIKNAKKAFVPAKFLVGFFGNTPEYFSHGVNTEYFTPSEIKEPNLLCVANNGFIHDQSEDRKGFGIAIEAARRLNYPITIAGPINNKNYFDKFPTDYDKLTILYDLTEEQLKELYKKHSCFLHLSTLEAGHPNLTLLEAMASGLPVVGTYEDNNSLEGMVKVERDVEQTIKAINKVFDNHTNYSNLARQQAIKLSWKNRTKELLKHYKMSLRDQMVSSYMKTKILNKPSKPGGADFNINFINGAFLEIIGGPDREYYIEFTDSKSNKVLHKQTINKNHWVKTSLSYFVDWSIFIDDGINSYEYKQDFTNKRVYIALDSKSLGDTLAWFPYVEEFRKKHNCKVVCSTFWNHFFESEYPTIEFVKPGETVNNLYGMYTIGWFYNQDGEFDLNKVPNDFRDQSLQKTASDILGLDFEEVKPKIKLPPPVKKENIVAIAIHSTAQTKYWNNPDGWQEVVDYLRNKGYRVVMLSKEEDGYMGNKYPEGVETIDNLNDIDSVIKVLQKSVLFIGISSGLSWLSWAVGTTTCLISGMTDPKSEFDCIRVYSDEKYCRGCFNKEKLDAGDWNWCPYHKGTDRQFECTKTITSEDVISKISHLV